MKVLSPLDKMDFKALDAACDSSICRTAESLKDLIPYLMEMRSRLSARGKRTDLDTPKGLTWMAWKESKREKLGMAPSTVDLLLRSGDTRREKAELPLTVSGSLGGDAKSVFEELASRLNALVPSLSDGVEHKTVSLLQQAPESVTSDLNETDTLHLEEVIYLLETVSRDFAAYAKCLRSAVDTSALTLPTRVPTRHGCWAPQVAADKFAEVV